VSARLFLQAWFFRGLTPTFALDELEARDGLRQLRQHVVTRIALFEPRPPQGQYANCVGDMSVAHVIKRNFPTILSGPKDNFGLCRTCRRMDGINAADE
jgi:hypothetical protein